MIAQQSGANRMDDPIYSGSADSGPVAGGGYEPRRIVVSNQSNGTGWSIILVFACVALGFTASAADYERIVATSERNQRELLATECSAVEGQLEDLGKFLANPHTRLIPLAGSGEFAADPAAIAWNAVERHGYFLCDDLPVLDAGSGYELWALQGMAEPVKIEMWNTKPGISVYPFRFWQPIAGKMRLEVTAGPRSVQKNPFFAGEIE
jgi:hypothetical protein